jgi:hypothetical protein
MVEENNEYADMDFEKWFMKHLTENKLLSDVLKQNKDIFLKLYSCGYVGIDYADFVDYWKEAKECIINTKEFDSRQDLYDDFDYDSLNENNFNAFVIVYDMSNEKTDFLLDDFNKLLDLLALKKPEMWLYFNAINKSKDEASNNKITVNHIELIK